MGAISLEIEQILALVGHNNQRAFDAFYHLYYGQVFRTAYYYVKDAEACREIVSNVFFSVWKSRKKLLEICNLDSYLYITTKNEALHYLAQSQHVSWQNVSLSELPVPLEISGELSPENDIITSELEATLAEVVNELPEKCRIIFLMSREEGMDNKCIAERLFLSESTVRVQLKIAIQKIIDRLKNLYPHLTFSFCLLYLF